MRRRHVACVVEVSLMTVSLMFVSGLAGEATAQDAASDTTDDMKLDMDIRSALIEAKLAEVKKKRDN